MISAEPQILQNNRLVKQLQEKLLSAQYDTMQQRRVIQKQTEQQKKRREHEEYLKNLELQRQQRSMQINEKKQERMSLMTDYQASIAEKKRREAEQRQKKLEEGRKIAELVRDHEIQQRLMEKQRIEDYKKEAERQIKEKQSKIAAEQQRQKQIKMQELAMLHERVKRQKQWEEQQRKYYKNFNQVQNKRLYLNIKDSLEMEVEKQQLRGVSQTPRYQRPQDFDDQHSYRDYLRRIEHGDYREGLEIQLKEKQMRDRARRMSAIEVSPVDRSVYHPITNPIPVQRKNPNVIRELLNISGTKQQQNGWTNPSAQNRKLQLTD